MMDAKPKRTCLVIFVGKASLVAGYLPAHAYMCKSGMLFMLLKKQLNLAAGSIELQALARNCIHTVSTHHHPKFS